ncbi:MAG: carboxypeptidase-like regulatory domain-containing protein [Chloroflexota bacterium]|nr:carboxypeptidase-like regulatory domain-containing protein [Chloroflexota bacterium]
MRRVLGLALALLAIAAAIGWASPVRAEGAGSITGQVVNKTAGGSPIGGVEVALIAYSNGKATASQQKATVDATGKFEFGGLSTDNGTTYTVSATFQDADYTSQTVTLTSASPTQTVELDVYDSTTSDASIQVSNGHIVVFADQGTLQVLEVWRFSNVGTSTFIGTKGKTARATLRFTLPTGATSLSPGQGFTPETTPTGVVSTAAVPPGVTDINFTYVIPYQGSGVTISRKTDYPIANFRLLVQDTGVKVTSSALAPAPPQMINGTNYLDFTAGNLAKGVDLDASFSGIVKPSAASPEASFPWPWLLGGVAMLVLVVAVAYPQLKKRQALSGLPTARAAPEPVLPASGQEDALLRELARLDDSYEAGIIKEGEYRTRRAKAKASLMEIYAVARGSGNNRDGQSVK